MPYVVSHNRGTKVYRAEVETIGQAVRLAVALAKERRPGITVTDPDGVVRTFYELEQAVFSGEFDDPVA